MELPDVEVLLSMVKDLGKALDGYLAGASDASEAIPHILETCQQMRAKRITGPVDYWVGTIERHAAEIANPLEYLGTDGRILSPGEYLRVQLLKDIYYLRVQLTSAHHSALNRTTL